MSGPFVLAHESLQRVRPRPIPLVAQPLQITRLPDIWERTRGLLDRLATPSCAVRDRVEHGLLVVRRSARYLVSCAVVRVVHG